MCVNKSAFLIVTAVIMCYTEEVVSTYYASHYNVSVGVVEHSACSPSFSAAVHHEYTLVSSSYYCQAGLVVRHDAEPVPEPSLLCFILWCSVVVHMRCRWNSSREQMP